MKRIIVQTTDIDLFVDLPKFEQLITTYGLIPGPLVVIYKDTYLSVDLGHGVAVGVIARIGERQLRNECHVSWRPCTMGLLPSAVQLFRLNSWIQMDAQRFQPTPRPKGRHLELVRSPGDDRQVANKVTATIAVNSTAAAGLVSESPVNRWTMC